MNVLFLINYAGNGGSERYVESLISRLHPASVRCALCCNIKGRLSERLKKAGIPVFHLPMRHPFDRRAAKTLAALCRKQNIDLVHAQHPREAMLALYAERLGSGARVIYTAHLTRKQPPWWRHWNRNYLPQTAAVIALSEAQVPVLEANGVPLARICVIPNGVERAPIVRAERTDGTLTLLTLSRLSPEKGLRFLCDAAVLLRKKTKISFRILLAGDGKQRRFLEKYIKKKDLCGTVFLLGLCEDVSGLLAEADIYISPSQTETMSLAILEAMASGLPVVATQASANLISGCGLTAPYGDADAFSDALRELLENAALRARLGEAAARRHFDLTETCRRTAELYQRSLNHGTEKTEI